MKKKFFQYLPLLIVIVFGLSLRTLFLNVVPPSLNEDEAALGYNAFSLLKTGADEHGRFLPLALESFGDWKLPVYSYVDTIFVVFMGLSEVSVRLPSILSGVLGIGLIYFITQKLFKQKFISLTSAIFYAVSPWSIYFSRAAYEVNLATTFFLVAIYCFLEAVERKQGKKWLLLISGLFFGLPLLTYHSYIVFSPLFFIFLGVFFWNKLGKQFIYTLIPFLLFLILFLLSTISGGESKISTTSIFTNKNIIYNRVENFKKDTLSNPPFIDKIHTKYLGTSYQFLQNYVNSFSPTFLFDRGGEKLVHNLDGFGNIYLIDALFLFVGFAGMFFKREKYIPVILAWLILAPIPSSLTLDSPNSTRLFNIMPLFIITSSYGAWTLLGFYKSTLGKILLTCVTGAFILNVIFFFDLYFIHFGYHRAIFWHYGYKEAVILSSLNPKTPVVMRGPENFPYIYFLFYNRYDPVRFKQEVQYYPTTSEGFKYVKRFGRFSFVNKIQDVPEVSGTLYIDDQNFNQEDMFIKLPNGDPVFKYYFGKSKSL